MTTTTPRGTLVFDLDGTLIDSAPDLASSLDSLFHEMKIDPIGTAGTRRLIGNGITALVRSALESRKIVLSPEDLALAVKRFLQIYEHRLLRETRLYPTVEKHLERFVAEGWVLAICSNKAERLTRRIIDGLGLLSTFSVVAGPETFNCTKPAPQILTRTVEAAAGVSKPAILIGDSEIDIATAKAASIPVIAVSYGYSRSPLVELNPDAIVDSFDQLPAAIASLAASYSIRA
jgi:phosphoglycolate phosphatase